MSFLNGQISGKRYVVVYDSTIGFSATYVAPKDKFSELEPLIDYSFSTFRVEGLPVARASSFGYIPAIEAQATNLRFFESPFNIVPDEKRVYAQGFDASTARYIAWELNLTHPAPGRRIEYVINGVYYNADGSVLGRHSHGDAYVQTDWTSSSQASSLGWSQPGNWQVGVYRVELSVEGVLVAVGEFEAQ